jgi:hypothetical protein
MPHTCTHWLLLTLVILAGVDSQFERIAHLNERVARAASRLVI